MNIERLDDARARLRENMWTVGYQAGYRDQSAQMAFWRRSVIGTWAVNLVLSGVIAWLLWGGR